MAGKQSGSKKSVVFVGGVFLVGLLVAIGSILLGRADKGQIDVSATIANSNAERAASGVEGESEAQPIPEVFANQPNGGLVPSGVETPPSEETSVDTATTTGTTTEDTAATPETPASDTSSETAPGEVTPAQ